jgi:hypothetical protein
MVGGNIINSKFNNIIHEEVDEDILDLSLLDKEDAESIKKIYNSLMKK